MMKKIPALLNMCNFNIYNGCCAFIVLLIVGSWGCQSDNIESNEVVKSSIVEKRKYLELSSVSGGVIQLEGKIGDLGIVMDLASNSYSDIIGGYYYSGIGKTIGLSGSIDTSTNTLNITERNDKGQITGYIQGGFVSPDAFEGTWESSDRSRKYLVSASKLTLPMGLVDQDSSVMVDCSGKYFTEEQYIDSGCDSCVYIKLYYDSVTVADAKVRNKINRSLMSYFYGGQAKDFSGLAMKILKSGSYTAYDLESFINCVAFSKRGLGFSYGDFYYSCGAASPDGGGGFRSYDDKLGDIITLEDIFIDGYEKELSSVVKKLNGESSSTIDGEYYFDSREVLLYNNGLELILDDESMKYHISSIFIDFCTLNDLLRNIE